MLVTLVTKEIKNIFKQETGSFDVFQNNMCQKGRKYHTLHEILNSVRAGNDSVKKTAMQWEQNKFRAHQLIMGSFQASWSLQGSPHLRSWRKFPCLKLHCTAWLINILPVLVFSVFAPGRREKLQHSQKRITKPTHSTQTNTDTPTSVTNSSFETCGEDSNGGKRPLLVFYTSNLCKPHRFQSVLMFR